MTFSLFFLFYQFIFAGEFPAGVSTTNDWSHQAFNHPLSQATRQQKRHFGVGNSFFKLGWVEAPSSTLGRDGLGPTYNAISCSSCHVNDGRGIAVSKSGQLNLSLLFRLSVKRGNHFSPHPVFGEQFQPFGINGVPGEVSFKVAYKYVKGTYPDGDTFELRHPTYSVKKNDQVPLSSNVRISPRVSPHLVGLGLIEAIPEKDLLTYEDANDRDSDGVSGRANWVYDIEKNTTEIGRFGWKAGQPSLKQQNAAAFIGDMGLTSSLFPKNNCPSPQIKCANSFATKTVEVSKKVLERVTLYTQLIAVPRVRNFSTVDFKQGERIFNKIQCSSCHRPSFVTGSSHDLQAIRGQEIWPYSDFLLHDMGAALADNRPEAQATGQEWRTPPLWSIGLIKTVNGHTNLLHDGRARNTEEAILWHDGEAENSRELFTNLSKSERDQLILFVNSL